jgi:hypothetical protein
MHQSIATEAEYGLHRVTEHAGRKHLGQTRHDGVLDDVAVLVLVDKQPCIGGAKGLSEVTGLQQLHGGLPNCRVVSIGLMQL